MNKYTSNSMIIHVDTLFRKGSEFIASYNEAIQGCNERIAELEAENVNYQESIDLIMVEIEKLEKEIEELKEQK